MQLSWDFGRHMRIPCFCRGDVFLEEHLVEELREILADRVPICSSEFDTDPINTRSLMAVPCAQGAEYLVGGYRFLQMFGVCGWAHRVYAVQQSMIACPSTVRGPNLRARCWIKVLLMSCGLV